MVKVYVEGFKEPFGIVGDYIVSQNENEIVLFHQGKNKTIKRDKVVYIEEDTQVSVPQPQFVPPQFQSVNVKPEPLQEVPESPSTQKLKEILKKKHEERVANRQQYIPPERASQIEPPEPKPNYDVNDLIPVEVHFNGSKEAKFDLNLPRGVMTGKYSSSLGKEIFKHTEVKTMMARSNSILEGMPVIKGDKIFYTLKSNSKQPPTTQEKLQDMSKLVNLGGKLSSLGTPPPDLNSKSNNENEFSMRTSPFVQVPTLTIEEPDAPSKVED